jgi:hypothetical protein
MHCEHITKYSKWSRVSMNSKLMTCCDSNSVEHTTILESTVNEGGEGSYADHPGLIKRSHETEGRDESGLRAEVAAWLGNSPRAPLPIGSLDR